MFSDAILTNLLVASAALAAPSLEASLKRRAAGRRYNTTQYLEAPANNGQVSSSSNWAGAVYVDSPGTFTLVSGIFTIPNPTGSGSASAWVGIDGCSCQSVILQTGVDFAVYGGEVSYQPWYQWYPEDIQYFYGITFSVGDVVRLTVAATSFNTGTAYIENVTKNRTVSQGTGSSHALCLQDAEWIVEDFKLNESLVEFANFGNVVFTGAVTSTSNGTIGPGGAKVMDIQQNNQMLTSSSVDSYSVTIRRL